MPTHTCPSCHRGLLRWKTRRGPGQPVDRFACERCGYVLAEEDWTLPLAPLRAGRCRNCGGGRRDGACTDCGLTEQEDREVHEELRQLIHPTADLFASARLAAAMGRRLVALKLATAASHDGPRSAEARALRVNLLRQVGEGLAALSDARQWVADTERRSAEAWAAWARELAANDREGEAMDAYRQAIELAPNALLLEASYAALLVEHNRFALAHEHARRVLAHHGDREATLAAIEVMARCARQLIDQGDETAVAEVLRELGERARRHDVLVCASAWLALRRGREGEARRELKAARRLRPDSELASVIERQLKGRRRTWWSW